jgi:fatty-acid peroxygenase
MLGKEAAELISDPARFMRSGAAPRRIKKTLLGRGAVQGLDGAAHHHRKAMFMSLMTDENIARLTSIMAEHLGARVRVLAPDDRVTLYGEMQELLTRSVCAWAGVPLEEREVQWRTAQLSALFDRAGAVGPAYLWARLARIQAESWCRDLIRKARLRRLQPSEESALFTIAWHRDPCGALLDTNTAAVELLNILRPVVAVSVYIVFVALALHEHPAVQERLRTEDSFVDAFVHEVRRFYPFFPFIGALTRCDFEWSGYRFPRGTRVLLDLYGTNHDRRIWDDPSAFRPERFHGKDVGIFGFIPQGPGDYFVNHRCPGEALTIELMKLAARFLSSAIEYQVPRQDLRLDWRRLPALPRSRFVLTGITTAT